MIKFKPQEVEIIGAIKKQIRAFIKSSNVIGEDVKKELIEEIGDNWNDDRFDASKFIDNAVGYSIYEWKEQNLKLAELWKEIAINNARTNNKPYEVANKTVLQFQNEFNCD